MTDFTTIKVIDDNRKKAEILSTHEDTSIPWYARGRLTLTSEAPVTTTDTTGSVIYLTPTELGWFTEISLDINPVTTGDTVLGSPTLSNIPDTSQLGAGMTITGAGIPALTTISAIVDGTTVTMSANATATAAGVAVTFGIAINEVWDVVVDIQNRILQPVQWLNFGAGTSTRNVAVGYDRGIPYLSDARYKLLGTFRTSAADTIADTITQRFLANVYNRRSRKLFTCPGYTDDNATTTYVLANVVWASLNGGTGSTLEFVSSLFDGDLECYAQMIAANGSGGIVYLGIGVNTTTSPQYSSAYQGQTNADTISVSGPFTPPDGYNYFEICGVRATANATAVADLVRLGATADPYATFIRSNMEM